MAKPGFRLALFATLLALIVVLLGAYTRLTHAGLGCPDWPGCYGFIGVPMSEHKQAVAEARFPEAPVEVEKGWNEMVHRYFAGSLGLLRHVEAPLALPSLLGGFKNGFALSVTGAVVGEMVMGGSGLGTVLTVQRDAVDTTGMFATIAWLCVIAATAYSLITWWERRSAIVEALT